MYLSFYSQICAKVHIYFHTMQIFTLKISLCIESIDVYRCESLFIEMVYCCFEAAFLEMAVCITTDRTMRKTPVQKGVFSSLPSLNSNIARAML